MPVKVSGRRGPPERRFLGSADFVWGGLLPRYRHCPNREVRVCFPQKTWFLPQNLLFHTRTTRIIIPQEITKHLGIQTSQVPK